MKSAFLRFGLTIFIFVMILGCDALKPDGCDVTDLKSEYQVTVTSNQFAYLVKISNTKYNADKLNYKISYTKVRCGGNTTNYYTSPMYSTNAKNLESTEGSGVVSCSTDFRNSNDYLLVEMTCYLLDIEGNILISKAESVKYDYDDVDKAAHNGVTNVVPYFSFAFY